MSSYRLIGYHKGQPSDLFTIESKDYSWLHRKAVEAQLKGHKICKVQKHINGQWKTI
jgi:hypothetical protein